MKRLLITGASGFVGSQAIQPAIQQGFEVHAISRKDADLLDPEQVSRLLACVRPTHLLHFAWYVEPSAYWTSPANDDWAKASQSLIEMFKAAGGVRLMGIGSSAEHTALDTPYGRSKLATHDAALKAGISAAWGRLYMVYGPNEPSSRFIPTMIRTLLHGGRAKCSPADSERDLIHVRDAARAAVSILSSDKEGAFDIGSGVGTRLRDVVALLIDEIGHGDRITFEAGTTAPVVADVTRLQDEVGFRPDYTLREGLRDTIRWWRTR